MAGPKTTTSRGRPRRSKAAERRRLEEQASGVKPWQRFGPYLSERQWGTVREDYSQGGTAWAYFPHDHARSRAYRWGEDGIAGFSDEGQRVCLALALWNGRDPILKERMFGLTNAEGNHGEDVKELYWYLDGTPTASYLEMLYKYPQAEFPYQRLVEENRRRGREAPELEILDTGVFDDDRYFDVFVEYAKADASDVLLRVTVHNRASEAATLHVLAQLWFRNTWSWAPASRKPSLWQASHGGVEGQHPELGSFHFRSDGSPSWLFTENETNARRLFGMEDAKGPFKDAFHEHLVERRPGVLAEEPAGTKTAAHHLLRIPAHGETTLRFRVADHAQLRPFDGFDEIIAERIREADEFHAELEQGIETEEARRLQRQAFAGLVWNKQYYHYNVRTWLAGDPGQPSPPPERRHGRNHDWDHLNNAEVISMPDKWEYPWYASWDLAFHCLAFARFDPEFAKQQLVLMTREWYMHANGALPAYEWAFGDVNPPVHAWATWRVFQIDRKYRGGAGDIAFLERVFHKLLLNFTWWVNRKDAAGHNVFQGGFLGLDNIGVFDRSAPLPTGGHINQADGTSWMAMYSLNLLRISLELALHNPVYEDIATKFFEHFLAIASAMARDIGDDGVGLWHEADEFFYDALQLPDGHVIAMRLRSMVGLIPLFAVETLEPELLSKLPSFTERLRWYLDHRPDLARLVSRWNEPGKGERSLLSLLRGHRMKCLLRRMLDETEFLSPYGVRALSRRHRDEPYVFDGHGTTFTVRYEPGESTSGVFGGNSNWRGPIWFPVNYLIIESLQKFHHYYGDDFKVECPTGSGKFLTIDEVAREISHRLTRIFLRGPDGHRAVNGGVARLDHDPHFRDHVRFFEYFDGDTGRGCGAEHQTGWTALVAKLLFPRLPG
ncbi:hypothetical protein BURK2_00122 [Burkholderiales bacterium]|jgi:hypothetical protein|nr:hypothetical protein BURK2_00122 [Burkholderiales bacterium]